MFIMLKFVHSLYNRSTATAITLATDMSLDMLFKSRCPLRITYRFVLERQQRSKAKIKVNKPSRNRKVEFTVSRTSY